MSGSDKWWDQSPELRAAARAAASGPLDVGTVHRGQHRDEVCGQCAAARAATPPVEPYGWHAQNSCDGSCSPDREAGLRERIEALPVPKSTHPSDEARQQYHYGWDDAIADVLRLLASDKPGLACKGVCEYDDAPHHHEDGAVTLLVTNDPDAIAYHEDGAS